MSRIQTLGPVGFNLTGNYDETKEYEKLDVVYYEGSSYVATASSIGQLPTNTEYWDCIAVGYLEQNIYDTVAEMKADDTLKNGMYARTVGYYSANDGGGATYKITDTESETEYQEEVGELYATLIANDYVTPEMLGAYGDNIHDDSEAINKALLLSKNLHLLNKTYLIENTINLNDNNKIVGSRASVIHKTTNGTIIRAINKSGIILDGFTVTGDRVNTTNQNGISLTECSNCNINDIKIDNISHDGVFLSTCQKINVSNMDISNTSYIGYICYQGDNCIFENSTIDAKNSDFKYNCQFKSTVNSTMKDIMVLNGTENSVMISRENLSDNPDSIIPINNVIQNIKIVNHGKYWTRSDSGTYAAMFVEGYNTIIDNVQIYNSYTGGFAGNFTNGKLNNLIVDNFALDEQTAIGCHLYDGSGNNINNIIIKKGVGQFGFRTNYENSKFNKIRERYDNVQNDLENIKKEFGKIPQYIYSVVDEVIENEINSFMIKRK